MNATSRDTLIDDVKYGRLTPDQAEAEAARRALPPLAHDPDPVNFNSMKEPYWTLPMAAAWIAFRTPDAVREWWDKFRSERLEWRFQKWQVPGGPVYQGHFLEPPPRATLALFQLTDRGESRADRDPKYSMTAKDATDALWKALRGSCFDVTGIDQRAGERVSIPAEQWRDLEWFEERGRDVVRADDIRLNGGARCQDVTVPMRSVVGLWPSGPKPKLQLPDLVKPEGAGYMPLYCAAHWIATEGGVIAIDPDDQEMWKKAFDILLSQVASEEVNVVSKVGRSRSPPIISPIVASATQPTTHHWNS
jgi:hypothetical protein